MRVPPGRKGRGTFGAIFGVLVVGGIRSDPLRALVALGALAFAAALAVGTHLTGIAATSGLLASGDELDRHADLQIVASGRGIDERIFPRARAVAGVIDARAVLGGDGVIGWSERDPSAGETIHVLGVDLLQPIPGTSGTDLVLPGPYEPRSANFDPSVALDGGAMLSARIADTEHLQTGDRFVLLADGRPQTLRVAYVFPRTVVGVDPATVFVDLSTAQGLFASDGFVERIDCSVPKDLDATAARIAAILPPGTRVERPRASTSGLVGLLLGLQQNLDWLAAFTLLLAALFTYNAVGASVTQRRGEIATMRGLGAKRRAIFAAFLSEGVLYGTLGSFAGALFGIAAARAAIERFAPDVTRASVVAFTSAEFSAVALAIVIGIVVASVSAALPALQAMRVPPASALGLGSASSAPPPVAYRALAQRATSAIRDVLGTRAPAAYLAAHELFATPRRTSLVLVALALAIANAIGYTIASSSFARATAAWADATMRGDVVVAARDLGFTAPTALPSPTLDRVRAVAGVATAVPARSFVVVAPGRGRFELRGDDSSAPQALPSAAPDARETPAYVTSPLARRLHVRTGDRLTIATPAGTVALRVAGVPDDFADADGVAVVRFARTAAWFRDDRADTIVVRAVAGTGASDVRARIARTLSRFQLDVRTTRELRTTTLALFDRSFAIAGLLGSIALAIAIAGVCAMLATLVLERRAQFGMLRYVGASRGFVGTMVVCEAGLLAAGACAIGTIVGVAGAYVALDVAGTQSFGRGIPIDVPFAMLATTLGLTFVASLLAALPAARSAGRIGADARPA